MLPWRCLCPADSPPHEEASLCPRPCVLTSPVSHYPMCTGHRHLVGQQKLISGQNNKHQDRIPVLRGGGGKCDMIKVKGGGKYKVKPHSS